MSTLLGAIKPRWKVSQQDDDAFPVCVENMPSSAKLPGILPGVQPQFPARDDSMKYRKSPIFLSVMVLAAPALQCGGCRNPAPWYLSILKPCS